MLKENIDEIRNLYKIHILLSFESNSLEELKPSDMVKGYDKFSIKKIQKNFDFNKIK